MHTYQTIDLSIEEQVATVTLLPRPVGRESGVNGHEELAHVFTRLREDNRVRVVVLTGTGGVFKVPPPRSYYETEKAAAHLSEPAGAWRVFSAIIRCHQTMAEMEKPIVCKVNGDAIGFGQSLVFASDLIVAREDARFMDHHMGGTFVSAYPDGPLEGGHEFSSVPGDGGLALVPLFMSPCKAKEYLMLAQPYQAQELARLGIINYAVPADELDRAVKDIVRRLLQRGAYALAWTKRIANRRVVEHLNLTLDAGVGFEMVTFLQRHSGAGAEKNALD